MPTLVTATQIAKAQSQGSYARLVPLATDTKLTSASAMRFGAFVVGDEISIVCDQPFYLAAGSDSITATTSMAGLFNAGTHDFTMPDGCTHVSILPTASATATAWKS